MIKTKLKFALSLVFLSISVIFVGFFYNSLSILTNYIFPVLFAYFVYDSIIILFPKLHSYISSKKHMMPISNSLSKNATNTLKTLKNNTNKRAIVTFTLYFGVLTVVGILFLSYDFFKEIHIYLLFLLINVLDYFCIIIWCPFRALILKNSCCYTCRITNWDRLMKFYILIFIPNIFTVTLGVLGLLIFIIWEYHHQIYPERFYLISNKVLQCNSCTQQTCHKRKSN